MISIDTETTGLDLYHGCKPFMVTIGYEDGSIKYFEWPVNPLTREPIIPHADLDELRNILNPYNDPDHGDNIGFVLHNSKFDVTTLATILPEVVTDWLWEYTQDTLIAGHLLASNQPHDLTSMVLHYLGVDIEPYETKLEEATKASRRFARSHYKNWRIAKNDMYDLPSASGDKAWRNDTWLPAAVAKYSKYDSSHEYWSILTEYANADSASTLALWKVLELELRGRGLWDIYRERMKLVPIAYNMERRGVTVNALRLEELRAQYAEESETATTKCVDIASSYIVECHYCGGTGDTEIDIKGKALLEGQPGAVMGPCDVCNSTGEVQYDLHMPKTGSNQSLSTFVFDVMKLPVLKRSGNTGAPSLDKYVLEDYEAQLPPGDQLEFIRALRGKRKRDSALSYLEGYERYWLKMDDLNTDDIEWYLLHPNLNITGTDTLRWSSSKPNEQNIGKQAEKCKRCAGIGEIDGVTCSTCFGEGELNFNIRYCFGPAPGREWWSLDAKNIELRIPAYEAGEEEMIALFEHPDDPPYYGSNHLLNFHTVYPDIWEEELELLTKELGRDKAWAKVGPHCKKKYASTWYQWCKNGGFGVQYGAMDRPDGKGTADKAFHRPGSHAKLKARFRKILGPGGLNDKCILFAERHGYVETIPDKSVDPKRGYPVMCTRTEYGKILPTVPLNYHVQSTAMWWTARAMVRVSEQFDQWRYNEGYDAHIALQVHDELVVDLPKGNIPDPNNPRTSNLWRIRIIQDLMEQGGRDIGVPTPTGCEYHPDNWAEGITL